MKQRYTILILTLLISPVFTLAENEDSQKFAVDATQEVQELQKPLDKDEQEKQAVQAILSNFACVAGNFFNIVAAPNDPQNVGNSIAGMINGMINIAVEAFKNAQLSLDADEETIRTFVEDLTKKLETKLAKVIVTKMKMKRT